MTSETGRRLVQPPNDPALPNRRNTVADLALTHERGRLLAPAPGGRHDENPDPRRRSRRCADRDTRCR
jgi:hypothetical protein